MTSEIPHLQQAAVIESPGDNAKVAIQTDIPVGEPGPDEILIKLAFTGLCGSEVRAIRGYGPYNQIVGHEGVGIVVKAGPGVTSPALGQRVGIKWLYSACGKCIACLKGFPNNCPNHVNTGRHVPGTLQQYAIADARFVTLIPDTVTSEVAAPLLCAGLTMSGAISKLSDLDENDWVIICGSGGGLGHIGVQLARIPRRFRVIAVDTGRTKRDLSLECGADHFIDFEDEDVEAKVKQLTGEGAGAVVVVAGSEDAFALAPKLVRNMGLIVTVGLPHNDFTIPLSATLCSARALTVTGVATGTEQQMVELLRQAEDGKVTPSIEVAEFHEVPNIFERLKENSITGRVVVRIPQ
ncbi:related to ADH3 - alcohol dehydrogenase III [Cephalotrichum gorgonifer]|uniref:Related to ADH3 - alcohol dehydrogenase III n=1 Tax=Cephalotrichum gorgonifer TaxID=2041049 RepID=A0AAE8MXR0_9PEZI|nr:related to ADH3 - alcohol dehydrogenase III [Cephalotrichum gorgonifer]